MINGSRLLCMFCALQICAVGLQWKCIEKTVILKNYSSLLLTFVRCIFYKLKIVILALFSCSLFCIELSAHITSFHCFLRIQQKNCKNGQNCFFVLYKFNLTIYSHQAWLAQWQSAGLVSERSQVQILLMTDFFFFN